MADQGTEGFLSPFLRKKRINAIFPFIKVSQENRVLDYGCGSGALAHYFTPEQYVGIDRDQESLDKAMKIFPEHTFLSPEQLDENARFDLVVALAVIEHMTSPSEFLKNMNDKLAHEKSIIIITTPKPWGEVIHSAGAAIGLFSKHGHAEHKFLLDKKAIYAVAEEAGLKVGVYRNFLYGINQLAILGRS